MAKYLKLPAEVEAIQYEGGPENIQSIENMVGKGEVLSWCGKDGIFVNGFIKSREGTLEFNRTDWVIKGSPGEFWVCSDEYFQKSYSEVK